MSEIIESLHPAPEDLRAIFYDEDAEARPQEGERVVAIARVKSGARYELVPVVLSPEGELELADDDDDYLGLAWAEDDDMIRDLLTAEAEKRHPGLAKAKAKKAAKKAKESKDG
jgi:hypothetical protein